MTDRCFNGHQGNVSYDGSRCLETFLMKFQRMAAYLCWDDEDTFHHPCASLDGVVGQVLWDAGPCVTTADLIHLLQTRFGTQLQAESLTQSCVLGEGTKGPFNHCTRTSVGW